MAQTLSSPNRLVRAYASAAWSLVDEAAKAESPESAKEKAASAVAMAVACVETYLNVVARLWLAQDSEFKHRGQIERDLQQKKGLGRKIEEWPLLLFQEKADLGSGAGQRFKLCLETRNRLMHFTSDAHTFEHENIIIRGLIDTTAYEELSPVAAKTLVRSAEDFIEYLLRLQGIPSEQVAHALHHWLGRPPGTA